MIRKTPIISSSAGPGDIAYMLRRMPDAYVLPEFEAAMSRHTGCRYIHLTGSGVAALYIILKALSGASGRTEVVLPAYTAGSLIVAIRKAGLIPVLCDISLKDLNADGEAMIKAVSDKTLAVICIHMFGIPMNAIETLKQKLPPGVMTIEDCAQAMGSAIGGKIVGSFGDASFFSFNRGKNLPVSGGGCIATNDAGISEAVTHAIKVFSEAKGEPGVATFSKAIAFSLAAAPYIYGAFYGMISRFKEVAPPLDFPVRVMSRSQVALALSMLGRFDRMAAKRYENGMFLINGLKDQQGMAVPEVGGRDRPAFNRFPIVFKDRAIRELVAARLWRAGIESSRMYARPLHHMFDLGYVMGDFPNACHVADQLLVLPTHPSLGGKCLTETLDTVRGALK